MPRVEITLLGGFSARVDGAPVADGAWRLRKARDLVKLLALAPGQRLHREQAMDALWRDRDPAAAANNLYQAVHAARRALGPDAIAVRDEVVQLDAGVDVVRAELAAAEAGRAGTPSAYRAALALLADELLPENRYDDWAAERRDDLDGLRESLAAALGELGTVAGLRALPASTSSFVGREHELADLRALLPRTRLLTLTGTGGTGKTRLALELARGAERAFADGAALVELDSVGDPGRVADALADALDVRALPGRTPLDAVLEFLAPRRLLLVVDNCEHLLPAVSGIVEAALRAAPAAAVLATSREPLRVGGEIVFRVPSLAIADPARLPATAELLDLAAIRLFVERAAAAAPGFALDDANAADVARICFRLDGLPLALELAAGRMGALTPAQVAERLDDRFRLLRASGRAEPTRQQTLTAALQWSHDLLEPPEQALFRRLAVFAGGFELDAVEAVCAGDGVDARDAVDLLALLVEKSLVAVDGDGAARRYRMLESVRLYAQERLDEIGETQRLLARHARWALAAAEATGGSDVEAANLRLAFETLLDTAPDDALRLGVALRAYRLRRIELREANRQFTAALAARPERDALRADALLAAAALDMRGGERDRTLARSLESLEIAVETGDAYRRWRALKFVGESVLVHVGPEPAEVAFEQARALADAEGLDAEAAVAAYSVGVARWNAGLPDAAERLEASLALFDGCDRRVPAPFNIGDLRSGRRPGVAIVLEETLQPYGELDCQAAAAYARASLAAVVRSLGDLERATELLAESAEVFDRLDDDTGRAAILVRRGFLALARGEPAEARELFGAALELRRALNDRRGVGLALTGLAGAETAARRWRAAEARLEEARALFRRAGDRWGLTNALWRTADLGFARGDVAAAEAALGDAAAVLRETGLARWVAITVAALGEAALLRGDADAAAAWFAEAEELQAHSDDPAEAAAILAALGAAKPVQRRRR